MDNQANKNFNINDIFDEELRKLNDDIKLLTNISNELNVGTNLPFDEKIEKLIESNYNLNIKNSLLKEKVNFLNNKNRILEKQLEEFESHNLNNKFKKAFKLKNK